MNPLLPDNCFVPDAEARVMPDGRLYIYGSWDISGSDDYCSRIHHCFSTDDMENWTDHGVIFRNDKEFCGIPWSPNCALYAPDAIEKNGKYYLYVCGSNNEEGVAVADSPAGPFSDAKRIEYADGDAIDPSVFVDDDGQGYLFWGQCTLRGAKLADDMMSIIPETLKNNIITEWEHGFHEGASIRKRNGKYYMVYTDVARGRATCLSYAMADAPLGPYKKCGVIIDNVYCDPASWNNHGSIAEFKGQWYVFYHRSSQKKMTCRRVCAEPIFFDENGYISEVKQTSQGASAPLDAAKPIPARSACRMMRNTAVNIENGKEMLFSPGGSYWVIPDWAEYKYINFGEVGFSKFSIKVKGKGTISVKIEDNHTVCSLELDNSELSYSSTDMETVTGIHTVYLSLDGEFTVEEFFFE